MYAQCSRCYSSCFPCACETRRIQVEVRTFIERVMILVMLVVTCVGHLYAQGYHSSGGQCVLRVIQDMLTVDAQTVLPRLSLVCEAWVHNLQPQEFGC